MTPMTTQMNASNYLLDNFIAQGMSKLTECRAEPVATHFGNRSGWFGQFTLNSTFGGNIPHARRAMGLSLIHRAIGAIEEFDDGVQALTEFLSVDRGKYQYFRALRKFEASMALLYQALDLARKAINKDLFDRNDGSPFQRLNTIYNTGRHRGPHEQPEGQPVVVYLANEGLRTAEASLSFAELQEMLLDLARTAERIAQGEWNTQPQPR